MKEKIEKFDNSNILIDTNDKLPNDGLKNVVILAIDVIKDDITFYPRLFLKKALFVKYVWWDEDACQEMREKMVPISKVKNLCKVGR